MADAVAVDTLFDQHRRFLWSLCYRMTGSAADADDIVQDTFLKVIERPPRRPDESVRPWLVKVALNRARDVLRSRRRREYTGPWLPSPIETASDDHDSLAHENASDPPSHEPARLENRYELLESVSFAFLIALEALTPTQRAVLLLRDVFDYSVRETASALELSEANTKTIHHRARQAMSTYDSARQIPSAEGQAAAAQALKQFLRALEAHDVPAIETLLAEDVRATTDGGGEFRSALRTIVGREKVMRFFLAVSENAANADVRMPVLNGVPSVVVDIVSPAPGIAPRTTLTAELDRAGKISHLYAVSATRKLTAVR